MVFYTGLARLARDAGLVVREVNGWKSRTLGTRPKGMAGARGCLWHHTATSASAVKSRNNPTLNYMVNGLGYPLANFGLAWDGSIDVIAAGAAAHAGKGRYGSRIPKDQGNDFLFGVEVEGTVGLTWSDAQLESAARLGHAMNKEWGSSFLQIGHLEYAPTRKVDPSGIPGGMPALRKAIARGYWKNKNWKPGGKVSTGSSTTKPAAKPKPNPSKPAAKKKYGEWPTYALLVDGKYQSLTKRAYQRLLAPKNVGNYQGRIDADMGPLTTKAEQTWLKNLGFYRGLIDGQRGPVTIKALQRFLRSKRFYSGLIDGKFQVLSIKGLQQYLNSQRKFYK